MEYKSPPLKTIQLKSLVLQLRGGRPGKEQGQLAVKDTDLDYLRILTNYPQQAEYIRNKNRLDDNITIKIYSDKEFKKLVATVPPDKIPNNLKRPESVVSNIKGELAELAGLKLVSKTTDDKPKVGAPPASESGAVAAGAGKPLEEKKNVGTHYPFVDGTIDKGRLIGYEKDPYSREPFLWKIRYEGKVYLFDVYFDRDRKTKRYSDEANYTVYVGELKNYREVVANEAPKPVRWYDGEYYDPDSLRPPDHPKKPKPVVKTVDVPASVKWFGVFDFGAAVKRILEPEYRYSGGMYESDYAVVQDKASGEFFFLRGSGEVLGSVVFEENNEPTPESINEEAKVPFAIKQMASLYKQYSDKEVEFVPLSSF